MLLAVAVGVVAWHSCYMDAAAAVPDVLPAAAEFAAAWLLMIQRYQVDRMVAPPVVEWMPVHCRKRIVER